MEDPTYLIYSDDFGLPAPRFDLLPSPSIVTPYFSFLATPNGPAATGNTLGGPSYFQLPLSSSSTSSSSSTPSSSSCFLQSAINTQLTSTTPTPYLLKSQVVPSAPAAALSRGGEKFATRQTFDGVILHSTDNIQKFLGYESLTLRNTSIYELIHPEDVDKVLQVHLKLIEQAGASVLSASYRILRRTGEYTQVQSLFSLDPKNNTIICSSLDLHPPRYSQTPAFFSEGDLSSSSSSHSFSDDQFSSSSSSSVEAFPQEQEQEQDSPHSLTTTEEYDDAHEADSPDHQHHFQFSSSSSASPSHFADRHAHSSEASDDDGDDDGTYGSSSHKIRGKPKARPSPLLQKPAVARTSHGNPKRERRMRRPPFGDYCGECHAPESTEWRKGPTPDHLLCNACGLRYTRKVKKERSGK